MPRRSTSSRAAALAALALAAAAAPAQAQLPAIGATLPPAALVPTDDPAYPLLDELAALVPVRGLIVGQRPYSRREVARLTRSACAAVATQPESARRTRALALLAELRGTTTRDSAAGAHACADSAATAPAIAVRPLEAAWLRTAASGVAPRPVPRDNGIGSIRAVTNPTLDARGGRPIVRGASLSLETSHAIGVGGWLALTAQPRVSVVTSPDGGSSVEAVAQRLAARAVWRNVALHAGVEPREWGQAGARSLFLSGNAAPLRAISVGSDTAFALPWVLRRLGRFRSELLVADLGRDREFAHSKLAAYEIGLTPAPWLELGVGLLSQMGGEGAPRMSLGQRARDLAPYVFWIVAEGSDPLASNKVGHGQLRLRVPQWRSATLSYELAMDDFDLRRVRRMLWEDTGHLLGVALPRLRDDGSLGLDVQLHRTSLRLYQHYQFTDGLTYHARILGSPLGPATTAGYAALAWRPTVRTTVRVQLAHEVRDSSQWRSRVTSVDEDGFDFVRLGAGVKESRSRVALEGRRDQPGAGRGWFARAGLERTTNGGFVRGRAAEVRPFGEAGAVVRF